MIKKYQKFNKLLLSGVTVINISRLSSNQLGAFQLKYGD
jgi:hypothetical protein